MEARGAQRVIRVEFDLLQLGLEAGLPCNDDSVTAFQNEGELACGHGFLAFS